MKIEPTRIRTLAALCVLCTSLGWSFARLYPRFSGEQPNVPWLAAGTMVVMCATVVVWALVARPRLQPEPGKPRMHPLVAARTLAVAMAASRVGSVTAGYYLGFLLANLNAFDTVAGHKRVVVSAVIVVLSVGTAAAGLWLERMCQIPSPPNGAAPTMGAQA